MNEAFARVGNDKGNVEKSRQRRSRPFALLTYYEYALRVKRAAPQGVHETARQRLFGSVTVARMV